MPIPQEHLHPTSGEQTFGTKLEAGTTLLETDLYSSTTGKWSRCPYPGVTLEETETAWVRPVKPGDPGTAKINLTACDQGHYGFASCGKCGAALKDGVPTPNKCPACGIVLAGTHVTGGFGGSDF